MRNAELTRLRILEHASVLFNTKGYKATSLSDICNAAQLTKGAIYKNFKSKAELEKEALMHMCVKLLKDVAIEISDKSDAEHKLYAILEYFERYHTNPPFKGGCPMLNASIEVDDGNPELKVIVRDILNLMHEKLCLVIRNGIKYGQIQNDVNVSGLASLLISSLEGAVMMIKVMDTNKHMKATGMYLRNEIKRILI